MHRARLQIPLQESNMSTDRCPDCETPSENASDVSRRRFLKTAAATAAVASLPRVIVAAEESKPTSENLVTKLYESLTPEQKEEVCFDWDYKDDRGILRTHVSNNWNITDTAWNVAGKHFSKDQQGIIEALFWGLYNPEWHDRLRKQLQDDAGGYGKAQTIALFGTPGSDKFEFVMTGRHLTIRCDGNTTKNVAFGGPIFYGHAASGFNEPADHAGNVYWHQALKANGLFKMLDGKQREKALLDTGRDEEGDATVKLSGKKNGLDGIRVGDLSKDQQAEVQAVLRDLLAPFRKEDADEAMRLIKASGTDHLHMAFYKSDDIGNDGVWDVWQVEGPDMIWHFRGAPHVHVWANIRAAT